MQQYLNQICLENKNIKGLRLMSSLGNMNFRGNLACDNPPLSSMSPGVS